jgi:uncharacterized protein with PQ loop repeat
MEKIFGVLAVSSSFYAILVGLTAQAWGNYKRKSVEGLSLHFLISIYVLYFFWFVYGLVKPGIDLYLVVPNSFALLIGAILFWQVFIYRKSK